MKQIRFNSVVAFSTALAICFVVLRNFFSPWGDMFQNGGYYSHYNNYLIFRQSFGHLLHASNLYVPYPQEYFDLYKYPPLFALLMAPFYYLPVWLGYGIWTTINIAIPFLALRNLSLLNSNRGLLLSLVVLAESITSALNSQSNGLVIGLLMLSLNAMLQQKTHHAVVFIWLSAFIKIFGGLFFLVFFCFRKQLLKAVWSGVIVLIIFLTVPAIFGGLNTLKWHYEQWIHLLSNDFNVHVKYSVMGWLQSWFSLSYPKNWIVLIGLVMQVFPLALHWNKLKEPAFYRPFVTSILIWMVIFNHMAESATYIIAIAPIAMWFTWKRNLTRFDWIMLLMIIAFSVLGPTDIYPRSWRIAIVETYQLKAFPCILMWLYLIYHSIFVFSTSNNGIKKAALD